MLGATLEAQIDFWQFRNQMTFFYQECWRRCSKKGDISGYESVNRNLLVG